MPPRAFSSQGVEAGAGPGVCVRDEAGRVVFQSGPCRAVCGDVRGRACARACAEAVEAGVVATGRLHGVRCELLVVEGAAGGVTVLTAREAQLASCERFFAEHELTAREAQVATLVLEGRTNAEIARTLGVSRGTVRTHLNRVHQKLPEGWLLREREGRPQGSSVTPR